MMRLNARHPIVLLAALPFALIATESAEAGDAIPICTPGPCNTWKASDVTLEWKLVDAFTIECNTVPPPFTQDGDVEIPCTVQDVNGSITRRVRIKIDKTAPRVANVVPTTGPNVLGWHTAPLTFSFGGTDASQANVSSGIAGCTQVTYSGPDTPAASVQGTCRDGAGNVSAPFTHAFKYDATAPVLAPVSATAADRAVKLRWTPSEAPVQIARTPGIGTEATSVVYSGPAASFVDTKVRNGTTYRYRATVTDAAGHATTQGVGARPSRGLLEPAGGARIAGAPRVAWTQILNAGYYNVQLYRGSRKILSAWPRGTAYALRSGWTFRGQRFKLTPGTYRVYVWPGFGAFAKQRYGRIVGTRTFVVQAH